MGIERRKIQLVAGTTYALSLPKAWVQKNHLKEKTSLLVQEMEDNTLRIAKESGVKLSREQILLNADEYVENIEGVLLKVYYMGFEKITFYGKKMLSREVKLRIRQTLAFLMGAEISYEDTAKMTIRILLDKSKVDVVQSLYRMSLIIDQMLLSLVEEISIEEMELNENETDRLYHLILKIVSLASTDAALLRSSKIENVTFITHYMLITKRLEVIADNIFWLADHLYHEKKKLVLEHKKAVADFLRQELRRLLRHILAGYPAMFILPDKKEVDKIYSYLSIITDGKIKEHLLYPVKLLLDCEEDVVSLSFYKKMEKEGVI